jgi:hypothetical protein
MAIMQRNRNDSHRMVVTAWGKGGGGRRLESSLVGHTSDQKCHGGLELRLVVAGKKGGVCVLRYCCCYSVMYVCVCACVLLSVSHQFFSASGLSRSEYSVPVLL